MSNYNMLEVLKMKITRKGTGEFMRNVNINAINQTKSETQSGKSIDAF